MSAFKLGVALALFSIMYDLPSIYREAKEEERKKL